MGFFGNGCENGCSIIWLVIIILVIACCCD